MGTNTQRVEQIRGGLMANAVGVRRVVPFHTVLRSNLREAEGLLYVEMCEALRTFIPEGPWKLNWSHIDHPMYGGRLYKLWVKLPSAERPAT